MASSFHLLFRLVSRIGRIPNVKRERPGRAGKKTAQSALLAEPLILFDEMWSTWDCVLQTGLFIQSKEAIRASLIFISNVCHV
ncbi:hypothetical protein OSTOST_17104 [Ostertagia ostertagi]